MKQILCVLGCMFLLLGCRQETEQVMQIKNAGAQQLYFGQAEPDSIPQIFGPGFISTALNERDASWSPDGKQFYYSISAGNVAVIVRTELQGSLWSDPEIAPFSGRYSDLEPFVAPNGNRLYFASNRPLDGTSEPKDYDIWYVEASDSGWGDPVNVGPPVNSNKDEFYPSVTRDGTLYFTASFDNSMGGEDIYRSVQVDGEFQAPENLGSNINSVRGEFNALVSPDETFLVFSSFGRQDAIGGGDLYISFRYADGSWSRAILFEEPINSTALDFCPALTPDGRFFVFTSRRSQIEPFTEQPRTLQSLKNDLNTYGNGQGDLYWVDAKVIHSLK